MKPFLIFGSVIPEMFPHGCCVGPFMVDRSIKLHPNMLAIRNKRKRARMFRFYRRQGITTFEAEAWRIFPIEKTPSPPFQSPPADNAGTA